jgi:hypothetical protein
MIGSKIAAHPFILSNFGSLSCVANCSEYTAIATTRNTVFLFRSQKLVAQFKKPTDLTSPITHMSIRASTN